jgi:hypothetical protein
MTPADLARKNAISFETKKDGLTQRQSGDWQLRLTIAALDMDQRITSAPMGTRFACVLVEINDDETPRNHKMEDRGKWRELGPTRQAGIRCKDPIFRAFLRENGYFDWVEKPHGITDEECAARAVRDICNVLTRSDLDKPGFADARLLWFDLDTKFQAWKAREHA